MRIGVFGGTFNPVHFGHLRPLEEVRIKCNLDKIYFVLAKIPPHKVNQEIISAKERYSLLKKALKSNEFFHSSGIEVRRKGPSYTYHTVKYFLKKFTDDSIFLIVGSDAFLDIKSWFNYEKLLNLVDIIVMIREGKVIPEEFLQKTGYFRKNGEWINKTGKKISLVEVNRLDISSSLIRKNIKKSISIKYLMPETCLKYIMNKKLYR